MKRAFKVTGVVLLRTACGALGMVGLVTGILMCVTIILAPLGVLTFIGGIGLLGFAALGNPDTLAQRFPRKVHS